MAHVMVGGLLVTTLLTLWWHGGLSMLAAAITGGVLGGVLLVHRVVGRGAVKVDIWERASRRRR